MDNRYYMLLHVEMVVKVKKFIDGKMSLSGIVLSWHDMIVEPIGGGKTSRLGIVLKWIIVSTSYYDRQTM